MVPVEKARAVLFMLGLLSLLVYGLACNFTGTGAESKPTPSTPATPPDMRESKPGTTLFAQAPTTPPLSKTSVETDREALLAFYYSTDGENWNHNAAVPLEEQGRLLELARGEALLTRTLNEVAWGRSHRLSDWYGILTFGDEIVSCGAPNSSVVGLENYPLDQHMWECERVTMLSLNSNGLGGQLPSDLGGLFYLYVLELCCNELTGEIPPELGRLTELRFLNLGFNRLTGEIPQQLGELRGLWHLDLSGNDLEGDIPTWLGELTNLEVINLADNNLTGEIPKEIGELPRLWRLFLGGNQLTGCVPRKLSYQLESHDLDRAGLPFC